MVRFIITTCVLGLLLVPAGCGGKPRSTNQDSGKTKGISGENPYDYSTPTKKRKVAKGEDPIRMMVAVRDTYLLKRQTDIKLYFEERTEGREEFWQSRLAAGHSMAIPAGTKILHHTDKNSVNHAGHTLLRVTVYDGDDHIKGQRGRIAEEDLKPAPK